MRLTANGRQASSAAGRNQSHGRPKVVGIVAIPPWPQKQRRGERAAPTPHDNCLADGKLQIRENFQRRAAKLVLDSGLPSSGACWRWRPNPVSALESSAARGARQSAGPLNLIHPLPLRIPLPGLAAVEFSGTRVAAGYYWLGCGDTTATPIGCAGSVTVLFGIAVNCPVVAFTA